VALNPEGFDCSLSPHPPRDTLMAVVEALHLDVIRNKCAEMKDHQGEHTFTNEHHYSLHIQ